jgi:hypothetical protein
VVIEDRYLEHRDGVCGGAAAAAMGSGLRISGGSVTSDDGDGAS